MLNPLFNEEKVILFDSGDKEFYENYKEILSPFIFVVVFTGKGNFPHYWPRCTSGKKKFLYSAASYFAFFPKIVCTILFPFLLLYFVAKIVQSLTNSNIINYFVTRNSVFLVLYAQEFANRAIHLVT